MEGRVMSGHPAFDTLAAVRTLQGAGMDSAQAEAVTEMVNEAVNTSDLATRADLSTLRAELRADLAALETRMTWRMFLVVGGLLALATALERLLG